MHHAGESEGPEAKVDNDSGIWPRRALSMIDDMPSSGFDWVTERANCTAVTFFERLYLGAEKNTNTRNEAQRGAVKFSVQSVGGGLFSVVHEHDPEMVVRFRLEGQCIKVEPIPKLGRAFEGTLTLNNNAKCRLKVGNEELDEWQVLKRALEPLFFPG